MAFQLNNIVLVGVGGAGMSALARLFFSLGYKNIIGIDNTHGQMTDSLEKLGVTIRYGRGVYEVQPDDVLIYSDIEAIKQTPELQQSFAYEKQGLKHHHRPWTYNEFLAELTKLFITISITGTNGKSSTTALAISVGEKLLPHFGVGIVGALLPEYDNANLVINRNDQNIHNDIRLLVDQVLTGKLADSSLTKKYYFILESCEHKEHMLMYDYDYLLVTNIGYDHQDHYKTQADYYNAFVWAMRKAKRGALVPSGEQTIEQALAGSTLAHNIKTEARKNSIVAAPRDGTFDKVFGDYRQSNAGLVAGCLTKITATLSLAVDAANKLKFDEVVSHFPGLGRRMELLGETSTGAIAYTDYGHHPDAIERGLHALRREYPTHKVIMYFEPHQAQRLLSLWKEFSAVTKMADTCYLLPIYHAREDFSTIQPLLVELFDDTAVASFDELHEYIAAKLNTKLLTDAKSFAESVDVYGEESIIVVFSAGNGDAMIRNYMQRQ